jgi:RNA polymerase sigma-70 factor (ECF subfamily)
VPSTSSPSAAVAPSSSFSEAALVAALREGDEAAFAELVRRHHASLRRVARGYVASDALADEVVQDTWLAVIAGIDRFQGRSSVKTWIYNILANIARTRGVRERRSLPFSALAHQAGEDLEPSVPPERFQGPSDTWPGHWSVPPCPWQDPDRRLTSLEAREHLRRALATLPSVQQAVVTLRDVEGFGSEEVCAMLDLSAANQRVLLHRGRARLRAALEPYMEA